MNLHVPIHSPNVSPYSIYFWVNNLINLPNRDLELLRKCNNQFLIGIFTAIISKNHEFSLFTLYRFANFMNPLRQLTSMKCCLDHSL